MKTKSQDAIPDSRGNATGYSYAYDDIRNRQFVEPTVGAKHGSVGCVGVD